MQITQTTEMLSQNSNPGPFDFITYNHNHCVNRFEDALKECTELWRDIILQPRVSEGERRGKFGENETDVLLGSKLDHRPNGIGSGYRILVLLSGH